MSRRRKRRRKEERETEPTMRDRTEEAVLLDAILGQLAPIPGHVLRRYHRITPRTTWTETGEALRRELRRGRVKRENWEGGSYITIAVPGRFRLDLEHEIGTSQLVAVDLRAARSRSKKAA